MTEQKDLKINEAVAFTDNEIIALFMGFSFVQTEHDRFWNPANLPKATTLKWCHHSIDLDHFRTSWDWLMPVVAKIAEYRMAHPKETGWVCDCKIVVYQRILYREVVNFCKWFTQARGRKI